MLFTLINLLSFFAFFFINMIQATPFNTESIAKVRVKYFGLPYTLLPVPGRPDETLSDNLPAVETSGLDILFQTKSVLLQETKSIQNGREVTYMAGQSLFEIPLPVIATQLLVKQPNIVCELLEPDLNDPERAERQSGLPAEVMRMTEQYPKTIPMDYQPWYKWSKGIRCIQSSESMAA